MRKSAAPSQNIRSNNFNRPFGNAVHKRSVQDVLALLDNVDENQSTNTENIDKPNIKQTNNLGNISTITPSKDNPNVIRESSVAIKSTISGTRYKVVWGKPSTKKHKTWEGDGFVEISEKSIILTSEDGTVLSTKAFLKVPDIEVGQIITIGSKVVEIIEHFNEVSKENDLKRCIDTEISKYPPRKIKKNTSAMFTSTSSNMCKPMHANQVEPLVLPPPTSEHQWKYNTTKKPIVNVRVDSFLLLRLRPHQREGLVFLYRCIMGYTHHHTGAILADEMGLGKTLQCIALIWILLKYGPYGVAVARRVLVVTPSTLCASWHKEFIKWLGRERLIPYLVDINNKPQKFLAHPNNPVMIISYERFAKHAAEIEKINFDIIICDEAHRLKNANIKAAQSLQNLTCKKRILLTGTPIQNDLQEYFVLVDIANPGILGTYNEFKEAYGDPIVISQRPDCSEDEKQSGEEAAAHLQLLTSSFILRRTQTLLNDFLPTKTECVICCKMTSLQEKLYSASVAEWWNNPDLPSCSPLSLIVLLKKICNDPHLIKTSVDNMNVIHSLIKMFPETKIFTENDSGKLAVIKELINDVLDKKEKMVIVSCSTKMLDVLTELLQRLSINSSRFDGSTPIAQRQLVVEAFNRFGGPPILLLSSRAGGAGLSLPAASRLVLYDADWNPAIDNQAMARIWRDGQRKPVFIYRFLTTGTIEEKIYQRQIYKIGLSDAIADSNNVKSSLKLSSSELKDLFTVNWETESSTHELLDCQCPKDGTLDPTNQITEDADNKNEKQVYGQLCTSSSEQIVNSINQLKTWEHFSTQQNPYILQELGLMRAAENITFIFRKTHLNK